jgi:hypothetical protein
MEASKSGQEMAERWAWDFAVGPAWRCCRSGGATGGWPGEKLGGVQRPRWAVGAFGYWYLLEMGRLMSELMAAEVGRGSVADTNWRNGAHIILFPSCDMVIAGTVL